MASARSAWGIDLGNRALKAVRVVRDGDRFRIDDFEIIEHEQILSVSGDNRESLLQTALAQFAERHNFKGSVVGVGVSGQQSFARFIKLPPVEDKKIPEIVRFEAIQQIPFPLDDVEWSYQLFRQADSPDVEVGIFAMKKDLVNKQISYFTSLGLNVQVVQMHPLAVYNAMHYDGRTDQTTMFMDAGAENTDLIIAEGESVWLRTLPIGGNTFTEALGKAFKLSFAKAEELKRNAATSKYAKQIFQAMRPVFADLVAEVQRSMGFYSSVHRDARIARLVALGSTFQLPGLQKYLQQNLQIPVEKIDTFRALPPSDSKTAASFQEGMISLAGAYGLAIQAMGEGKITSSLLPAHIRRAKMWKEKQPWFGAAAAMFVVGALGVAGSYYFHDIAYDQNRGVRDTINVTLDQAKTLDSDWESKVSGGGEGDRLKLLSIHALTDYRDLIPDILSDIYQAVPAARYDELKKIKRNERPQVLIDSLMMNYLSDIKRAIDGPPADLEALAVSTDPGDPSAGTVAAPSPYRSGRSFRDEMGEIRGRPAPTPMIDPATPTEGAPASPRGFIVTIKGYTPNKDGGRFVTDQFAGKLVARTLKEQLDAKKRYHIVRAELTSAGPRMRQGVDGVEPVEADEMFHDTEFDQGRGGGGIRGRGGRERFEGEGNFRRRDFGARALPPINNGEAEEAKPAIDPNKCRIFPGEEITSDIAFTVMAVIVVDAELPKPPEEAAPAETPPEESAS